MKYWKVVITLEGDVIKSVNSIVVEEVIADDSTLINQDPIGLDDSSEQAFVYEKDMYKMLWRQYHTPHFARMPMTDKGAKMLADFVPFIRKKFPEVMI